MKLMDYKTDKATTKDIEIHLLKCCNLFSPPLDTYINISQYANKIRSNAVTIEAWSENELVGLVACYLNNKQSHTGHITNFSVNKEYQNRGIATKLIYLTIQETLKIGFNKITLDVEVENSKAIRLYKKSGFELYSRIGNKYSMINRIKKDQDILVSICCITYNHASYISDAIEGFLMQKTNFKFEILIHDDASTDGTDIIIKDYEIKHLDLIKPIYQKENQYSQGRTISPTYQFPRAQGKYIALCEGDDYWIDPYKLQKQVDFLENNSSYVGCSHKTETIYEYSPNSGYQFYLGSLDTDILYHKSFLIPVRIATSSLIFRKEILDVEKYSLYPKLARDTPLMIILSSFGLFKILPDIMSVYRRNKSGISENITIRKIYEIEIETANNLRSYLKDFYIKSQYIKSHWHRFYLTNSKSLKFKDRLILFLKFILPSFYNFPYNLKGILSALYYGFINKNHQL